MSAPTALDLRLAVGAAAAWLATIALSAAATSTVLAVALAGTSAAAAGAVLAGRGRHAAGALGLAGGCVAVVLLPLAGRLAAARASPLASLAAQRAGVTASVEITGDPHPLAARGTAGAARVILDADVRAVSWRGQELGAGGTVVVLAPAQGWLGLLPGAVVRVQGRLQPPLQAGLLVAVLTTTGPAVLERAPPGWQRAAGAVRDELRTAARVLPEPARGLLPGLIDGDTNGLDPVLAEHFRRAGLTHLIAVSGTNCSILVGAVLLVLRRLGVRPLWCAAAGGLVLAAFVAVARPDPSVLRAAAMALVTLAGLAGGRPRAAIPALAAAVIVLLAWDPQLARNAGFAMSVLATAAILLVAPGWAARLRNRHVPPGLAEAVAVATAAHLVTAPVVAAISGQFSVVAVPANVLAEPVVAAATVLGFLAAATAPLCPPAGTAFAWLAGWPARWLVHDGEFFGGMDGAVVPLPGGGAAAIVLALGTVLLFLLARRRPARHALLAAALVAVVVQVPVRSLTARWPPPDWRLVACDVGQGDALVLRAGPRTAVVVDTGPDPVAVDRCLSDLDVRSVALVAITHLHQDHVGGIAGVLRGRTVGTVLTGPLDEPAPGLELLRRTLAGRHLGATVPAAGSRITAGQVTLDVLGPAVPLRGTRSDPNNSSLVLRADVAGLRVLLPGDAEIEEQQLLLGSGVDLEADVIKVPHHGSAYSSQAFLAAARARVAVISVGRHNDYGHPSPLTLTRLDRLGVPVRRTDEDGDVAVCGDGADLTVLVRGPAAVAAG
ncbi:MAG: ComEC/Rec2 family competence protein [Jatrophihabitans sp.]|nr:MAG: ComEC/Rec2 family competence protein [Jatrophihabitans sp.]